MIPSMSTVNKLSLREEVERLKNEFDQLAKEKKINSETKMLCQSMLMLINLLVSIFLEKTTKKTSKNSSIPPSQTEKDEVAIFQNAFGIEKRTLIENYMKVDESKAAEFWKLYETYENSRRAIGLKRIQNITKYAENYENFTPESINAIMKNALDVQKEMTSLWGSTYKKMSKVITPVEAAKFIQAEMYIENTIRQALLEQVPLIGELR